MIAQTYCGKMRQDAVGDWWACNEEEGPCPSCLREHVAKLEEALAAAEEEILLSRKSEGETMRDLLETREKLATTEAAYAESLEVRRVAEAEGGALNQANNEIDRLRARNAELEAQAAAQAGSVVPELTRQQATDIANEAQEITGRSIWPSTVEAIAKVMRSRALPASRVLGEGERVVSMEEWEALRKIAVLAKDFQDKFRNLQATADSWGLHVANEALAKALRTQPTEGGA